MEEGVLLMKQRPRIYYSDSQKTLMWGRWKKDESLNAIARLFDRGHASVARLICMPVVVIHE